MNLLLLPVVVKIDVVADESRADVEPPADLADEDEELYAQYQHSQHLEEAEYEQEDESLDYGDDDSWLNNEEWQRAIDGVERALSKTNEDTLMSED